MKKEGYYIFISTLKGEKPREFFFSGLKVKILKVLIFSFIIFIPIFLFSVYYFYRNLYEYILLKKKIKDYETKIKKIELLERKLERIIKYTKQVNYMLTGKDDNIEVKEIQREKIEIKKEAFLKDEFIPPLNGIITRGFSEKHPGVDIFAPLGSPVFSCGDGIVIEKNFSQILGFYVKIKHKNNIYSLYAHLKRVFVNKGEFVKKGDIIGEVGSTGETTGPHLHFEIIKDNKPIYPYFIFLKEF